METNVLEHMSNTSNGGKDLIEMSAPFSVAVTLRGACDLLFHRWNCESVETKAKAAKNSAVKKTDDLESYVYRNEQGELCIPGEYLRQALIQSARFIQDPRSPRKSAMDLFKAGLVSLTHLASLGVKTWDYLDRRRCTVQRQGVNRTRPAMREGWRATFVLSVLLPEYIDQELLLRSLDIAGRLIGVGDFRPTYGRFSVVEYRMLTQTAEPLSTQ